MISLRTNLSSLITQQSFGTSTNKVNLAIERMSTGYKINHASDNAAGYSIATNMNTQISACDVASNNIAMGMDLLSVAQDTIEQMQDKANKLHSLITQARNGTYGAESLNSINLEAGAIIAEINRLYNSAEYDGIGMIKKYQPELSETMQTNGTLNGKTLEECVTEHNGFIREVDAVTPDIVVSAASDLEDAINNNTVIGIANADVLAEFAKIVNGTNGYGANDCSGKIICLTGDIVLDGYDFTQIGSGASSTAKNFVGTFNGNGHVISNFKGNSYNGNYGLFGNIGTGGCVKNLGIEGTLATSSDYSVGVISGCISFGTIDNCWTNVKGSKYSGSGNFGGIAGGALKSNILNCYSVSDMNVKNGSVGGILGSSNGTTTINCFSSGNIISSSDSVGGIVGSCWSGQLTNCYSTGNIKGRADVGGIAGFVGDTTNSGYITNCYSTGNVDGKNNVGGIVGRLKRLGNIANSYSTGDVKGENYVGGFVGYAEGGANINGGNAFGAVNGNHYVGGAIGSAESVSTSGTSVITIKNLTSYGTISGSDSETTGSFIGRVVNTSDGSNFTAINMTNCQTLDTNHEYIGGVYKLNTADSTHSKIDYDIDNFDIDKVKAPATRVTLQVGIYGNEDSQISFDVGFNYNLKSITKNGCNSDSAYNTVMNFMATLSDKSTELGSITNKLDSALESISTCYDNLVSSRSTLRDADIGQLSATYIQQQILQQAAATLMSTANQSPAIALQLI